MNVKQDNVEMVHSIKLNNLTNMDQQRNQFSTVYPQKSEAKTSPGTTLRNKLITILQNKIGE